MTNQNIMNNDHEKSEHEHSHSPDVHHHEHLPASALAENNSILTIRSHSGLSGDMLLTGFAVLAMDKSGIRPESVEAQQWLDNLLGQISSDLPGCVKIGKRKIEGIAAWHAFVKLPDLHDARGLEAILNIIESSSMPDTAKHNASRCFDLLANCEAEAHGIALDHVHFHEVGALDSILDICGVCLLYDLLASPQIVCSSLPLADGFVSCSHGILPVPAPAVLQLLKGVKVRGFGASGEVVTPTAIALLHSLNVTFGQWPAMQIEDAQLVYGGKTFKGVANGATFAIGKSFMQ